MLKFEEIISKFQIEGEITDVKPLGHGTVNTRMRLSAAESIMSFRR